VNGTSTGVAFTTADQCSPTLGPNSHSLLINGMPAALDKSFGRTENTVRRAWTVDPDIPLATVL
jgi:hypothetical protein